MKANEMGRAIRDDERAGKAEVHLIDAGEVRHPEKLCEFLGEDIPDELPEEAPESAPPKVGWNVFLHEKAKISSEILKHTIHYMYS